MRGTFLLTVWFVLGCACGLGAVERENIQLGNLERVFYSNPSDHRIAVLLLKELKRQGRSGNEVLARYFKTQDEADYLKDYNWKIVCDYVNDLHAPQIVYVLEHQDKFIQHFSKEDVFQKLDDVLVNYLERFYSKDKAGYDLQLSKIKDRGYEHYDVVSDYFNIRELRSKGNAEDYFYKARKLFRYFPENRKMIKEITAGALEIMTDVDRLRVIQLWAGKTVENTTDFDAVYNYVLISKKCGYADVARKYAGIAGRLAQLSDSPELKKRAGELLRLQN